MFPNRTARPATLWIQGQDIPVIASLDDWIDTRDRRGWQEGYLWTTAMDIPTVLAAGTLLDKDLDLVWSDGTRERIRLVAATPRIQLKPTVETRLTARFMNAQVFRKDDPYED